MINHLVLVNRLKLLTNNEILRQSEIAKYHHLKRICKMLKCTCRSFTDIR